MTAARNVFLGCRVSQAIEETVQMFKAAYCCLDEVAVVNQENSRKYNNSVRVIFQRLCLNLNETKSYSSHVTLIAILCNT